MLPELTAPSNLYYDSKKSMKYHKNSRIIKIQSELTEIALDLLQIDVSCPFFIDIGCGSGISSSVLKNRNFPYVGIDNSINMLSLHNKEKNEKTYFDLVLKDISSLCFKDEVFDYAISISAVQWLFHSFKKDHCPIKRIKSFFKSLYSVIRKKAVLQFYCKKKETEILLREAKRANFYGGLVIYKENTKNQKNFLLLSKDNNIKNINKLI